MSRRSRWKSEEFSQSRLRDLKSRSINKRARDIFAMLTEHVNNKSENLHDHESDLNLKLRSRESHLSTIKSDKAKMKIKLSNDIIVHEDETIATKFDVVIFKFVIWDEHDTFVNISSDNYMSIILKSNWANKIKSNKIYSLELDERKIVNEIFDNLHFKSKMKWSTNSISFDYLVFVIYRIIFKDEKSIRKERVVIDIRELNVITLSDAYLMSAQIDIIVVVADCNFISIVDAVEYFHQWAIKFENRHKFIVISHREQKQFNVCVMSYKNSLVYVQRQTNLMLSDLRNFVRAYIDDIVIFFKTLEEHLHHLSLLFNRLLSYNVILNSKKAFLDYSSIVLLDQMIDALDLITVEKKLTVIVNLIFFYTLKKLEIYVDLIDHLRVYVLWYAQVSLSLQQRKILLLKDSLIKEKSRKIFSKKIILHNLIAAKLVSYKHLQSIFRDKRFLHHCRLFRKLFIDVDSFKKREMRIMIFHVKDDFAQEVVFNRSNIELIMFFSKILTSIETRYWLIELEMIDIVWVMKKVRHLIETSQVSLTVIFIDHAFASDIVKQTSLNTTNFDKLNLRLIRVSQYLSSMKIEIRVRSKKFHVISNALSRLINVTNKKNSSNTDDDTFEDLDVMFLRFVERKQRSTYDVHFMHVVNTLNVYLEEGIFLIEMINEFQNSFKKTYIQNTQWAKLLIKLRDRRNLDDAKDIDFSLRDDLIYYTFIEKSFRLCILWFIKRNIYRMTHDDHHHCDFHRVYARVIESLYIRHLIKRLRRYIRHCRQCIKDQIIRHFSYDELNLIQTLTLLFHTIIIDFVIALSSAFNDMNSLLFTTDKFSKRINLMLDKNTWFASEWVTVWLDFLQREKWDISRAIISNRNSKFLSVFWKATFNHLDVILHFTIAYHLSTDQQFERINQTIEIVMRFTLMQNQITNFTKLLSSIQAFMNNSVNAFIDFFFNEVLYDFKVIEILNMLNLAALTRVDDENSLTTLEQEREILRTKTEEAISFANAVMKIRYDQIRTSMQLNINDFVYLTLHKEYIQLDLINRKFSKQRLNFVYKLDVSSI
jgi:hypothetical protein